MIRFCANPKCGRGFIQLSKVAQEFCPTCRNRIGTEPLSRLVGGETREELEHRERQATKRRKAGA